MPSPQFEAERLTEQRGLHSATVAHRRRLHTVRITVVTPCSGAEHNGHKHGTAYIKLRSHVQTARERRPPRTLVLRLLFVE